MYPNTLFYPVLYCCEIVYELYSYMEAEAKGEAGTMQQETATRYGSQRLPEYGSAQRLPGHPRGPGDGLEDAPPPSYSSAVADQKQYLATLTSAS